MRTREFTKAMNFWGFDSEVWRWPDLRMSMASIEPQVSRVVRAIRKDKPTVVVSFGDFTKQLIFRHPDHLRTGEITDKATFAASVDGYLPALAAVPSPRLFWWMDGGKGSEEYFLKYYPSQFDQDNIGIVRRLGREKYLQVR